MLPHLGSKNTPTMDKVFPEWYEWASLGQPDRQQSDSELSMKAAKAMLAMGGAPKSIQKKLLLGG